MNNKEVANTAVTGLVGLVVAPIVVGVVAKSAGKCYAKIAKEVNRIKKNHKKDEVLEEENVISFNEKYRKMWNR